MLKIPKNNLYFKNKRNRTTSLSSFALTSSYFRPNNIKKNSNTIRLIKVKSQPYLKENSVTVKPIYDINLIPSKIMTPKNRIRIKDSLIESTNRTLLDNKSIFLSIISKIENIMSIYKKNTIKLNYLLIKIESFINSLIKNEEKYNKAISAYKKTKVISLKKNLVKSENENNIINKLESSNEMIKDDNNIITENDLLKKKINKLYQKINEMEEKFKIDELNYFFCIGDHQKKITELERKLNMKNFDKIPKEELKKVICYPHYAKFDVREDINPKSIPMFNYKKEKYKTDKEKKTISFFIPNEKDLDNFYKKIKNEDEKILSNKGLEMNDIKEIIKLGKQEYDTQIPIVDKFFGKKKSFFISHPKLNYIKVGKDGNQLTSWKIDNQLNNFPQQISKLKMSKSQKKAMIVFPSFFNETMVNLEKLRTSKNFQSIENKFEEALKINKKNNKSEKQTKMK